MYLPPLIWHNGDLAGTFNPTAYGESVARILALDQDGERLMPLTGGSCSSTEAKSVLSKAQANQLFPAAQSPEGALSGLWLYFSCYDECHSSARILKPRKAVSGTAFSIVRSPTQTMPATGSVVSANTWYSRRSMQQRNRF